MSAWTTVTPPPPLTTSTNNNNNSNSSSGNNNIIIIIKDSKNNTNNEANLKQYKQTIKSINRGYVSGKMQKMCSVDWDNISRHLRFRSICNEILDLVKILMLVEPTDFSNNKQLQPFSVTQKSLSTIIWYERKCRKNGSHYFYGPIIKCR